MRPLRLACGTVSKAQLLSLLGTISASAPGVVTTQLSPAPPASSSATDVRGSSDSRPATAQPPEPPPTTTKSNVSGTRIPPKFLILPGALAELLRCQRHQSRHPLVFHPLFWFQGWAFAQFLARALGPARFGTPNARFDRHKI